MNNVSTLITVIVVLSCAAATIILIVQNNRRKSAVRELNNAARKLVKEQNLSKSLKNPETTGQDLVRHGRMRMVVALEWKDREKEAFVFDPMESIRIGRQPDANNVIIPNDEVSLRHCMLYQSGQELILEDLRSTNGTILLHGLGRKMIRGRTRVYDGDRILLGDTEIRLHLFWIDSAYV